MSKQKCAGCNHIIAPGLHMSVHNPSFVLRIGSREWTTEWHHYFGPAVVSKRNGDYLKNQPGERSAFWVIASWWHGQGCEVVDGVGVWHYPEIESVECAKTGRILRFWKGYHHLGPVRKL